MKELFVITDGKDGYFYLAPSSLQNSGKYLFRCNSLTEAEATKFEILRGKLRSYRKVGEVPNINGSSTPIYKKI